MLAMRVNPALAARGAVLDSVPIPDRSVGESKPASAELVANLY